MASADALTASPSTGAVLADGFPNLTAKEKVMPQIGEFTRDEAGFIGNLATLLLHQDIIIIAAEPSDAENAPDYRVHLFDGMSNETGPEIGAAWKRTGEKAGEYVALLIDDPTFPHPIRANLFRDDDAGKAWSLHWSRPRDRAEKD
ncbi:uncharacterized protein (DUF736 family) [Rhodopseudomonas faecalis]|jgi:uncharacterized protein (DUF736 family)|uniref:Uncharacterized protein (DUF736 family) n=2 Tax=Rhodopseudomonas faecalis TaxID=99655 RepID=A0A318TGK3_9BRAD|nr:uncharacterized protein (DUF736 family) [Rhodopseudomonas faecalis]